MLTYQESVQRFNDLKIQLGIPKDADFSFVEKRHIEQAPSGEIEGMQSGGPEADPDLAGEGPDGAVSAPLITERVAWVGEFGLGFMFWELAIDSKGRLIRLRKSR